MPEISEAVAKLGVGNAKPHAIRQLMGCVDGDGGPSRETVKSHLQKYRLKLERAEEAAPTPAPTPAEEVPKMAEGGGGDGDGGWGDQPHRLRRRVSEGGSV